LRSPGPRRRGSSAKVAGSQEPTVSAGEGFSRWRRDCCRKAKALFMMFQPGATGFASADKEGKKREMCGCTRPSGGEKAQRDRFTRNYSGCFAPSRSSPSWGDGTRRGAVTAGAIPFAPSQVRHDPANVLFEASGGPAGPGRRTTSCGGWENKSGRGPISIWEDRVRCPRSRGAALRAHHLRRAPRRLLKGRQGGPPVVTRQAPATSRQSAPERASSRDRGRTGRQLTSSK